MRKYLDKQFTGKRKAEFAGTPVCTSETPKRMEQRQKGARRGKLDIIAEILLYCEQQKSKTSIMYNANLNHAQLKSQISSLTSQGLLAKNLNKYIITEKGYRFLELFAQLNDLLEEYKIIK